MDLHPAVQEDLRARYGKADKVLHEGRARVQLYCGGPASGGQPVVVKSVPCCKVGKQDAREVVNLRMAGQQRHPNVIALHQVLFDERHLHLVYEHCPGGSLAALLAGQPGGALGEGKARRLFWQVLCAVSYLHNSAGVVHGGVCAENIYLKDGMVKLAHFNCSASLAQWPGSGGRAAPHPAVGLPLPPRIRGEGFDFADFVAEFRAKQDDVLQLGRLLYSMVVGRPPVPLFVRPRAWRAALGVCKSTYPEQVVAALLRHPRARMEWLVDMPAGLAPGLVALLELLLYDGHFLATWVKAQPWLMPARQEPQPILGEAQYALSSIGLHALAARVLRCRKRLAARTAAAAVQTLLRHTGCGATAVL